MSAIHSTSSLSCLSFVPSSSCSLLVNPGFIGIARSPMRGIHSSHKPELFECIRSVAALQPDPVSEPGFHPAPHPTIWHCLQCTQPGNHTRILFKPLPKPKEEAELGLSTWNGILRVLQSSVLRSSRCSSVLIYSLTLRSKLNRLELTQDSVGRMQSSNIEFGFERKVIEFGGFPQPFQLDERA
jgi:hypothetical protein